MVLFVILIVLACVALGFVVLIQNPKGGGLSGSIAGFSNQFMGVKQTTDILEKGTWIFAALVGLLCILSSMFINKGTTSNNLMNDLNTKPSTQQSAPAPAPANPQPKP